MTDPSPIKPVNPAAAVRAAVASLQGSLAKAEAAISALETERAAVASAPPAPADIHNAIDQWVADQTARYRAPLRELLATLAALPLETDSAMGDGGRPWLGKFLSQTIGTERLDAPAIHVGAICLTAGELVSAALKREADALLADREPGLALAPRRARLADLDREIAAQRGSLGLLKSEARAAGVVIT